MKQPTDTRAAGGGITDIELASPLILEKALDTANQAIGQCVEVLERILRCVEMQHSIDEWRAEAEACSAAGDKARARNLRYSATRYEHDLAAMRESSRMVTA